MIGSATVPINYQEFQKLLDQPNPVLYYSGLTMDWYNTRTKDPAAHKEYFDKMQIRILKQDYRHYFGEVVDLGQVQNAHYDAWLRYLGNKFLIWRVRPNEYIVVNTAETTLFRSDNEAACQQWLCDHFTDLFKKDLPHLNIKFIWSN